MRRIMLVVAYDGTAYHGWQEQKNASTIESELNKALSDLNGVETKVIGASRTDAGVHAMGNVAVFDTELSMDAQRFAYALNTRLPSDIKVQSSRQVPSDWHPRKQDSIKTYEYRIYRKRIDHPLKNRYAYFCYYQLDVNLMRQASSYFIGEHDFASFCTPVKYEKNTARIIYSLSIEEDGDMIVITIRGNGFLYNMVRIIVGTLVQVGMGAYAPEHVVEIMAAKDRQKAGPTVPAAGLTLVDIEYFSLEDEY